MKPQVQCTGEEGASRPSLYAPFLLTPSGIKLRRFLPYSGHRLQPGLRTPADPRDARSSKFADRLHSRGHHNVERQRHAFGEACNQVQVAQARSEEAMRARFRIGDSAFNSFGK